MLLSFERQPPSNKSSFQEVQQTFMLGFSKCNIIIYHLDFNNKETSLMMDPKSSRKNVCRLLIPIVFFKANKLFAYDQYLSYN